MRADQIGQPGRMRPDRSRNAEEPMSPGNRRTSVCHRPLLVGIAITVALAACSKDDTADPLSGCDPGRLRISPPEVIVDERASQMGLLFISHRSCGFSADGSGYLGGDPPVVPVASALEVRVPSGFETSYSLEAYDEHRAALTDVATDDDQTFAIGRPDPGCYDLVVDVLKGDHQGRWETRLDVAGGGCPSENR